MSISRGLIARTAIVDTTPPNTLRCLPGSFLLTGEEMTPIAGYTMQAGAGAFAFAGQSATLTPPAVTSDAATTTWVNAVIADGGTVSGAQQSRVNTLIVALKTANIWTKFDRIWLLASENTNQAFIDLRNTQKWLVLAGTPTFVVNRGVTRPGAGTNTFSTGFIPSAGGQQYASTSAHFGAYVTAGAAANSAAMGCNDANYSYFELSGTTLDCDINGNGFPSYANTFMTGRFVISRTGANTMAGYRNGGLLGGSSHASGALSTKAFHMFEVNTLGHSSTMTLGAVHIGAGLNSTEVAAFDAAMAAYQTAIGN
jgi:hypothetical protein